VVPGDRTGFGITRVLRAVSPGFPIELIGLTADIGAAGTYVGAAVQACQ
jgi:hypothetical protein